MSFIEYFNKNKTSIYSIAGKRITGLVRVNGG